MPADVDLCNQALLLLGEEPLTNLDEGTPAARACKTLYPATRDALLRAEPWRFARVRRTLARLEATPPSDYTYYYGLPTEPPVLRVEAVDPPQYPYSREVVQSAGGPFEALATSAPAVTLLYTGKVAEGLFDPTFSQALVQALALALCGPVRGLAGSAELLKMLGEQAQTWMQAALAANRAEDSVLTPPPPPLDHRYFAVVDAALPVDVQICNEALLLLDQAPIASLTAPTPTAHACQAFYGTVRDVLLRLAPWRFARVRVPLVAVGPPTPASEYTTYYALPSDPAVLQIEAIDPAQYPYSRERALVGGVWTEVLATSAPAVTLLYTGQVEPALFDATFRQALVYTLAVRLAPMFGEAAMQRLAVLEPQVSFWTQAAIAANQAQDSAREPAEATPQQRYLQTLAQDLPPEVQICNEALLVLPEAPITSFDDGTPTAQLCRALYPTVRDALLRETPWRFARVRLPLARLPVTPPSTYAFYYGFPSDPAVMRIEDTDFPPDPTSREMVEVAGVWVDALATNAEQVTLLYTGRVDAVRFDAGFRQALVYRLAVRLAPFFGEAVAKRVPLWEAQAAEAVTTAKADNSHEDSPRVIVPNSRYLDARHGPAHREAGPTWGVAP